MFTKVGKISEKVVIILALDESKFKDKDIYLGQSNINHMLNRHPDAYNKYGSYITTILSSPDYIAYNQNDNSLEYVKEFQIDNEFVKVAVKASNAGQQYYARTIYVLNNNRVANFIASGTLKKYE